MIRERTGHGSASARVTRRSRPLIPHVSSLLSALPTEVSRWATLICDPCSISGAPRFRFRASLHLPEGKSKMQNGPYKVEFQTPLGAGSSVVFHQNGEVHGGDATMLYIGTMAEKDGEIVAEIEATTHTRV